MGLEFQALLVGVFAILPGFLSSAVRSVFVPEEGGTTAAWTVAGVLTSLVLNAITLVVYTLVVYFLLEDPVLDLTKNVEEIRDEIVGVTGWNVLNYIVLLYIFALTWGLTSGFARHYSPRHLAFLNHLTPIAPERDVFHRALNQWFRTKENRDKRGKDDQQVPWLKVDTGNLIVLGRLRTSNTRIYQEKPIEVYLRPAYKIENSSLVQHSAGDGARFVGLYLRIKPEQVVEIFSARSDWLPDSLKLPNSE